MAYICEFDRYGDKRNDNELFVEWLEPDGKTACEVKYVPERTCNRVVKTNERPGKTVFNQWYACSECGNQMGSGENFCASCGAKVVE